MSKLSDKLFLFSLEGALQGADGKIAASNKEMLRLLELRGGRYTVVSDLPAPSVRSALAGLPLPSAPVLCSGGAMLYDLQKDCCLAFQELSRSDAETLLWTLERAFPALGLAVQIYTGSVQIIRANSYTEQYLQECGFGGILIQLEYIPETWLNAMIFADPQQLTEVEAYIEEKGLQGDFSLVRRSDHQLQILPKALDYTTVFADLYNTTGILQQDVLALGGSAGDSGWMHLVGKSAAAADAPSDVKLAADQILLCNADEGAAAEFLYQSMKQYE